ncbi:MAG: hypothetical protein B7X12_07280 [Halothiobacillus sp. 20-53-49]|jgi:hypothetical protein|nr:MAG: hypothetical protein B7X12_07280 [Halothiobacillus sp. 20-53-49]HUN01117.1 antitoxin VbhA family protein [Halothiobacillus sp.]
MDKLTESERRYAHEQALASTRLEGHIPTPEFLADCEANIKGTMTNEQVRARSLARAIAKIEESAPPIGTRKAKASLFSEAL